MMSTTNNPAFTTATATCPQDASSLTVMVSSSEETGARGRPTLRVTRGRLARRVHPEVRWFTLSLGRAHQAHAMDLVASRYSGCPEDQMALVHHSVAQGSPGHPCRARVLFLEQDWDSPP